MRRNWAVNRRPYCLPFFVTHRIVKIFLHSSAWCNDVSHATKCWTFKSSGTDDLEENARKLILNLHLSSCPFDEAEYTTGIAVCSASINSHCQFVTPHPPTQDSGSSLWRVFQNNAHISISVYHSICDHVLCFFNFYSVLFWLNFPWAVALDRH